VSIQRGSSSRAVASSPSRRNGGSARDRSQADLFARRRRMGQQGSPQACARARVGSVRSPRRQSHRLPHCDCAAACVGRLCVPVALPHSFSSWCRPCASCCWRALEPDWKSVPHAASLRCGRIAAVRCHCCAAFGPGPWRADAGLSRSAEARSSSSQMELDGGVCHRARNMPHRAKMDRARR
jgi:hypothetical protein